jgi:hypothetical protein
MATPSEVERIISDQRQRAIYATQLRSNTVPNLPYKNNEWARLALRHIIDIAHKEHHDSIAIDGGDIVSRWATGGDGRPIHKAAMEKFYDTILPQMMEQEGFKHVPFKQTITNPNNSAQSKEFLRHRFYLTNEKAAQLRTKGQPMLSMLPWLAGGMGIGAAGAARQQQQ